MNEEIDPALDAILQKKVANEVITIGDKHLQYNSNFRLLITTRIPNPKYSPEDFVKVCIINFAITADGLEE